MLVPARLLLALLIALLVVRPAGADIVKPALIEINVFAEGFVRIEIRASIEALLTGIDGRYLDTTQAPTAEAYDRFRVLQAAELERAFAPFRSRLLDELGLWLDGEPAELAISEVRIPPPGYTKVPRTSLIVLETQIPSDTRELVWYYPSSFGDHAVRVRQVDTGEQRWHWSTWQWIREDRPSQPFSLDQVFHRPSLTETIGTYMLAGFDHIIPNGTDHILFVLGLFLFSTQLRPLLWQVTMFTIAHSITLTLAMIELASLPAHLVEPLIALSIVYVGVENIWRRRLRGSRLWLVFAFGLLHGLGFASMLSDFGMPDDRFAIALISFNVGVELGQLAVIGAAFATLGRWFGKQQYYRQWIATPGSLAIAATGLYWAWERIPW